MKPVYKTCRSTQEGATLIVALIFLLIMSIIAFTSMSTSVLEEKMSVNLQNHVNVFQVADSGLEQSIHDLSLLREIKPCDIDTAKKLKTTTPNLGTNVKAKTVVNIYYLPPPGPKTKIGNTDNGQGGGSKGSCNGSGGGAGMSWGGQSGSGSGKIATYQYKADSNSELVANSNIKASVKQGFFYCPLCQN